MNHLIKKTAVLCMIMLFTVGVLAGCGSNTPTPKKDENTAVTELKKKGKLVVGTASGYFPFEMVDKKGDLIGFDVDVAKAIAKELGVEVEFQNYAFSPA